MLQVMLLLVVLELLGDMLAALAAVPLPGMVIGPVLLLGVLWLRGRLQHGTTSIPGALESTAKGLHDNLGLMFVPASAGIIAHIDGLAADGVGLIVAMLTSTPVTIGVTALVVSWRCAVAPASIATESA